jgi:hypothetical protein
LQHLPVKKLVEVCTRLARFKKENKELLTYLLFEAHDEQAYVSGVKADVDAMFDEIRKDANLYLVKKSLRKILRYVNKHVRFSGNKQTEVELHVHFCSALVATGIRFQKNTVLANLYKNELKKIEKALSGLHEDLQYDYRKELDALRDAV